MAHKSLITPELIDLLKKLWADGVPVSKMLPQLGMKYPYQVYNLCKYHSLPARRVLSPKQQELADFRKNTAVRKKVRIEYTKAAAKDKARRLAIKQPSPVLWSSSSLRKLDEATRQLIDDAIAAGKCQKLPMADPDDIRDIQMAVREVFIGTEEQK